jgi:hypothetical protein
MEVFAGPGTEVMRDEVIDAVRTALGGRTDAGDWRLTVERRDRRYLVDLTNRNGTMCQWLFNAGDPIATIIREGLRPASDPGVDV